MHIALISDIHGNLEALDAVLTDIRRVDKIVCLGDVAATGPQPHEVVARLREIGCPVVLGNADAELLSEPPRRDPETDEGKLDELIRWGTAQLDATDLAYLRSLPSAISVALEPEGAALLCVHGSPRNFNELSKPRRRRPRSSRCCSSTTAVRPSSPAGIPTSRCCVRTARPCSSTPAAWAVPIRNGRMDASSCRRTPPTRSSR